MGILFDLCNVFQEHIPGIKWDLFVLCLFCDLPGTVMYKFDVRQKIEVISEGQYIALNMSSYRNRQGLGMASDACFSPSFSLHGDSSKI